MLSWQSVEIVSDVVILQQIFQSILRYTNFDAHRCMEEQVVFNAVVRSSG